MSSLQLLADDAGLHQLRDAASWITAAVCTTQLIAIIAQVCLHCHVVTGFPFSVIEIMPS